MNASPWFLQSHRFRASLLALVVRPALLAFWLAPSVWAGTLTWNSPTTTEYCLGQTPSATATPTDYHDPNVVYTYSWGEDPKPCAAGEYTITATETVSGDSIDLTVFVNTVDDVTSDRPAVMKGCTVYITATMTPHDMSDCITWIGDTAGAGGETGTLTVNGDVSTKGVKTVTASVGDPPDCGSEESVEFTVVGLAYENQADCPGLSKTRLTVGVGERTDVTTDPSWPVSWSVSGGGTVAAGPAASTVFKAAGVAGTSTVTAELAGCTDSIEFTVIAPSGLQFQTALACGHVMNSMTAGFKAAVTILPTSVSFKGIKVKEGDSGVINAGWFIENPKGMHYGDSEWDNWGGLDDCNVYRHDLAHSNAPGAPSTATGEWSWFAIPWVYLLAEDAESNPSWATGYPIGVVAQTFTLGGGGATMTKGSATATFAYGDPSAGCD